MEQTLDELRAVAADAPTDPAAYRALAAALQEASATRELAELHDRWAQAAGETLDGARALAAAAEAREVLGELDDAIRRHERALELDPEQATSAAAIARLALTMREPHRHVDALSRWLARLVEANPEGPLRADAELALARVYAAMPGKLERSFAHHREAVRLRPELEATLDESVARATSARRMADVRALLSLAVSSARSSERRLELLRALVAARRALPVDLDGAIEALSEAAAIRADDVDLLTEQVALLTQRAKKTRGTDASVADARAAAQIELRIARLATGDDAKAAIHRALALDPTDEEAVALLQALGDGALADADRAVVVASLRQRVTVARGVDEETHARLALSDWLARNGKDAEAYAALAPVLPVTTSKDVLARGFVLAKADGRFAEAGPLIERIHAGDPAHAVAGLEGLLADAEREGDLVAADLLSSRLLARNPAHRAALAAATSVATRRGAHEEVRVLLERRLSATAHPAERRSVLEDLVALLDGPVADPDGALAAFEQLAALDPRDAATRDALKSRLTDRGRARALADVLTWEVSHLDTVERRKQALDDLLALAVSHPFDATLLASALRTYRAAAPGDDEARFALASVLHEAGEAAEAAALYAETVRATRSDDTRRRALAALAELLEHALRDDEGAFRTTRHQLELTPDDEAAIARLERIAERHGHRDRLVEALEHRARVLGGEGATAVLLRVAALHEQAPADVPAAIAAYRRVREARIDDAVAAAALLRLYEAHGHHVEAAALLDELAERADDDDARVLHLKRRARLLVEALQDPDAAAECYRRVREVREDEEALLALIEFARDRGRHDELSTLLAIRVDAETDPDEVTELRMERATLLLDHLADPREAERELLAIRAADPSFAPALARLAALYLEEGDDVRLAEITEAQLAVLTQPTQRAALAKRLLGLHEGPVPDAARALEAARRWAVAAPYDLDALRAVAERLDPETHAEELVQVLDALADQLMQRRTPTDDDARALRDEALQALEDSVRTSVQRLDDGAHAEVRVVRALDFAHDDAADVERFVRLSVALDALLEPPILKRAAATFLARKATSVAGPVKAALFLRAADLFGGPLADSRRAFEVMRRAIEECSDDPEVLRSLVDYGTAGGFEDELEKVLEERFDASLDARAARALQRERADLLHTMGRYGAAADAYQRITIMVPDDERARTRHRECLMRAGRHQDLLVTLGQALRRVAPDAKEHRLELLREMARAWDVGLGDRAEAEDAWKAVLAASPDDEEARSSLARLTTERGGERRSHPPRGSIPPPLPTDVGPMPRMPSVRPPVAPADEGERE